MTDSPHDRIRRGYDESTAEQEQAARITADAAQRWRYDARLERAKEQLDAGQRVDPSTTFAVGYYLHEKAAAKAAGLPTTPPDDAA